jgi:predicted Zn-dependent protease
MRPPHQREEPIEIAERALQLAGSGADGFQVNVTYERSLLSRFARSAPTQATTLNNHSVDILCLCDGHAAIATTNSLDDDGLRATARRARTAARAVAAAGAGGAGGAVTSQGIAEPAEHDGFDEETTLLHPGRAGAALADAFAVAAEHGLEAFGAWTAGVVQTAIASTAGARLTDHVTDAFMKVMCRDDGGRTGYAAGTAVAAASLAPRAIAERAAAKVATREPAALAPGSYPVVLDHEAVGLLLDMLGMLAVNGLAYAEGRSALAGRLGERVAAPCITLSDAPSAPATLPRSFDAEGTPKATVALVADGVARGIVHDRRSAALAGGGARSTGHATEPGGSPWGPVPTNLVLDGGDAADVAQLAAPVERGIYVTRLWYVNPVREKETLLTGMTRDGTFLIEDGVIGPPLRDVRFTDSVLRILASTEALTRAQRLVAEAEFYGRRFAYGVVCPALRAGGFRVTA